MPLRQIVTVEGLLECVPQFPCVVVTGPERSGTTIMTEMISYSTGYTNIPEETWDNDFESLWRLLSERDRIVVHAPHLTYRVHEIDKHSHDRVLVVFMLREIDDIVESQRNCRWGSRSEHCPDGGDPRGWGNPASRWVRHGPTSCSEMRSIRTRICASTDSDAGTSDKKIMYAITSRSNTRRCGRTRSG